MNMSYFPGDIIRILPELVLFVVALFLLILGLFRGKDAFARVMLISKLTLGCVFVLLCSASPIRDIAFHGLFISDAFAILMKALVVAAAFVVLVVSVKSLASEEIAFYEYPILVLFATLGMLVMISANDLMSLFIGLELQSLSLYILTTMRRENKKSSEAGMKYFVLGALSTGLLLYGCSLVYGYTGTTNFDAIALSVKSMGTLPLPMMFGLAFLMAGLAFKISAVPFHMWTPDVYEGAPTSVVTFIASAPKVAGFALLTRVFMSPFITALPQWQMMLTAIAIGSMIWGAFAGLNQRNIKRLLAYSAIGNMGYALIGIVVGTEAGVTASILYILLYLIMIVGVFTCLLNITRRSQEVSAISDLKGLFRVYPGTAFVLSFLLVSMAGIPPLAGFLGKLYIFQAAVSVKLYFLAITGILTTVIAAAYYLWVVKVMIMDEPDMERWMDHHRTYRRESGVTLVLCGTVIGLIWIFIFPAPMVKLSTDAAASFTFGM